MDALALEECNFADLERALGLFGTALWGSPVLLHSAEPPSDGGQGRASFVGPAARFPSVLRGLAPMQAARAYRAAMAHIAAHLRFGGPRFPLGSLKPLQVALVSLVEDARVEHLAIQELPGLRQLWLPFHVARPSGALTAPALMARLARALIDARYVDDHAWVAKGRQLFVEALENCQDPAISRSIGGLLGNDLGQMRVQFNARTYAVEPLYRDDNLGLWDFGDADGAQTDADALPQPARLQTEEGANGKPDDAQPAEAGRARAVAPDAETGIPVGRYPEWDYAIASERPDWTTVLEYAPRQGPALAIETMLARHRILQQRISTLVRSARISRPMRLRRQTEGEQLDLEAALAAAIDRRTGLAPDPRVYARFERRTRDLSVLLLIDSSCSTCDPVPGAGRRVLDMEVEAAALLSQALEEAGDPFAVHAFCSNRRADIRYLRIKDFAESYDAPARRRLAGLTGQFSTRMGAALRHAGKELGGRDSYRRLLLVMSDGEPSDIDIADKRYLVEDARRAARGLMHAGIDVFGVGLGAGGEAELARIFGARNILHVDRLEKLPHCLAALYVRLTA